MASPSTKLDSSIAFGRVLLARVVTSIGRMILANTAKKCIRFS